MISVTKPIWVTTSTLIIAIALLIGIVPAKPATAQDSRPLDIVGQAIKAMGGVDALRSLGRIAVKGEVRHWEPEESYSAGGPPVFTDRSTFALAWDLKNGMARTRIPSGQSNHLSAVDMRLLCHLP